MKFLESKPRPKGRLLQAAYTLAEVMISTAILGTCAGSFMAAFGSGFITLEMMRENQRATQILIEKTETIRLFSWDQLNDPTYAPTNFVDHYDPRKPQSTAYTGTVILTEPPFSASYKDDVRRLTVTLRWTTKGVPRERSITTLVAKDGLQNYVY